MESQYFGLINYVLRHVELAYLVNRVICIMVTIYGEYHTSLILW